MQAKKIFFDFDTKKEIVERYFEGYSAVELTTEYGIGNRRRVTEWARKVREAGTFDVLKDTRGLGNKGRTKEKKATMEQEIEHLKLENLYLKKLIDLQRR